MGAEALIIAGIAVAVIGAGVSAYGQHQAGKTQEVIGQFNAMQREKEARSQLLAMQTQAALERQQAEANFKLRSAEAAARESNAKALENQALSQDAINRVNLQKRRAEYARLEGQQRANIAASGVSESTGTPLDLLAETVSKIQQAHEDQHFIAQQQRFTLFSQAANERLGGKLALAGATLNKDSQIAAAALREAAGRGAVVAGAREAEIFRLTGSAAKQAGAYQAGATLLSGVGSAAGSAGNYYRTS